MTSSVDKALEETHDAITNKGRGGPAIKTHLCANSWHIHLSSDTRVNRLRKEADRYLAVIESAGIEEFWGPTDSRPSVEAIYGDLGVIRGCVAPWIKAGHILMALPGAGGAIGASTVIEAAEKEAFKRDNRTKLGSAAVDERHLAIYVYVNSLPWVALVDFEPPPDLPRLPPEITDIWVFSEAYAEHEYVVWRAGTSLPWRKLKVSFRIGPDL